MRRGGGTKRSTICALRLHRSRSNFPRFKNPAESTRNLLMKAVKIKCIEGTLQFTPFIRFMRPHLLVSSQALRSNRRYINLPRSSVVF